MCQHHFQGVSLRASGLNTFNAFMLNHTASGFPIVNAPMPHRSLQNSEAPPPSPEFFFFFQFISIRNIY